MNNLDSRVQQLIPSTDVETLLNRLTESGRLRINLDSMSVISYLDTYETSEGCSYFLNLGTGAMPSAFVSRAVYLGELFSHEEHVRYIFLHELAHLIVNELSRLSDQNLISLGLITDSLHSSNPKQFFTGKASLFSTKKQGVLGKIFRRDRTQVSGSTDYEEIEEDIAELITMCLFDPKYFQDYMLFLCDEKWKRVRKSHNLVTLSCETARNIEVMVKAICSRIGEIQ